MSERRVHPAAFWAERLGLAYHPDNGAAEYLDRDGYALSGAERDHYDADHATLSDDDFYDIAMAKWRELGLTGPEDGA